MRFADTSRGRPFSKDPAVVRFGGHYFLYYSVPPFKDGRQNDGWCIGIARSSDLDHWAKIGELLPAQVCDQKGLCAPGAFVRNNQVHLFYQTYGNGPKDAICHAVSDDGLHFDRDATNPIFSPTGAWNSGRAIDADVIAFHDKLLMFWATRDPEMKKQFIGVSSAPLNSDYSRANWTQMCDAPILKPELPWEQACIEASALFEREGRLYQFYAGAYNNCPQQIGLAVSEDGIIWTRISNDPILPVGRTDSWHASESGHPYAFVDEDRTVHLFFQGNNDNGKTWYLSRACVHWEGPVPRIELLDQP